MTNDRAASEWQRGDAFYAAFADLIRLLGARTPLTAEVCLDRLAAAYAIDNDIGIGASGDGDIEYPQEALAAVWPWFEALMDPDKGLPEKIAELRQWAVARGEVNVLGNLARIFPG